MSSSIILSSDVISQHKLQRNLLKKSIKSQNISKLNHTVLNGIKNNVFRKYCEPCKKCLSIKICGMQLLFQSEWFLIFSIECLN